MKTLATERGQLFVILLSSFLFPGGLDWREGEIGTFSLLYALRYSLEPEMRRSLTAVVVAGGLLLRMSHGAA